MTKPESKMLTHANLGEQDDSGDEPGPWMQWRVTLCDGGLILRTDRSTDWPHDAEAVAPALAMMIADLWQTAADLDDDEANQADRRTRALIRDEWLEESDDGDYCLCCGCQHVDQHGQCERCGLPRED